MADIGDGTGNEILVTGALFAMIGRQPGVHDVNIPGDPPNAVDFSLDFMRGRYRVTVTSVGEQF